MTPFFATTQRTLALLIGFSIPISTALTNVLCPLAVLLILAEGQYQAKINRLRQHPIAVIALLLFVVMGVGFLYTSVPMTEAGLILDKYRELLYIPIFILLFRDEQTRRWGFYAFLSAMGMTLFLSYLMAFTGWSIGKGTPENAFVFKNYITQSLLLALAAYFLTVHNWNQRQWQWLSYIVVLLIFYNIIFLSEGRTGYLILFCLILLFSYQNYRFRGLIIGSLILLILSVFVYTHSEVVHQRLDKMSQNVKDYQKGETDTSVGLRLEFYKNSLILISQNPLFGQGTGSFAYEYKQLAQQQHTIASTNPHNEYLMIGVQWGLIGIGLFIYLLYQMWYCASHLPRPQAWMAQGLVVTMAVGCLVNSLLLDTTEGHIFAYLTGVFYGGLTTTPRTLSINSLIAMQPAYKTSLLALVGLIILGIIVYYATVTPPRINAPTIIDKPIAARLIKTINTLPSIVPGESREPNTGIAIDVNGATVAVNTQFRFNIDRENGLVDNKMTVSVADIIRTTSQITVDERHVGKAARIIMLAAYQPHQDQTEILFQRSGTIWEAFNINQLKSAQTYSQLPDHFNLQIYQGTLIATGRIKVFVAYVLEDNTLVLSPEPLRFEIIEPPVMIDETVALIMKVATHFINANRSTQVPHKAIGIDITGTELPVNTQFHSSIKTNKGLRGNNITVSLADIITVDTQIQVDERHIGQAAQIIMLASYQPPTAATTFFQRNGPIWEAFNLKTLKSAQSYAQLPPILKLPIYQGPLMATGEVAIFIAYLINNKELILNTEPLRLTVTHDEH